MPKMRPTAAAMANAITRPVRFMRLIPSVSSRGDDRVQIGTTQQRLRSFPRKRESRAMLWVPAFAGTSGGECVENGGDERLPRLRRQLAAGLGLALRSAAPRRPQVAAFIATGEHGAEHNQ